MNGPLNIVTAVEDNYAPALGVALYSLMLNSKRTKELKIHILTDFLSKNNIEKFKNMFDSFDVDFDIVYLEKDRYKTLRLTGYFHTPSVYYTIDIPESLPDVDKAVYFDCDLLIEGPIEELFDIDLGDRYLAATPGLNDIELVKGHKRRLGLTGEKSYFNAGVMLMDLKTMRERGISRKVYDFILKNPSRIEACDQDGLNYIVSGDFVPLDICWNFPVKHSHLFSEQVRRKETKKSLHFLGRIKPWFLSTWLLYKLRVLKDNKEYYDTYWTYLSKSPWKDTKFRLRKNDLENLRVLAEKLVRKL